MTKGRFIARLLCLGAVWGVTVSMPARAQSAAEPSTSTSIKRPDTYGTAHLSYVSVGGATFVPVDSATVYGTFSNGFAGQVIRTTTGAFQYFAAPLQLPSGAVIKTVELDACDDTGGSGYVQGTLIQSDALGSVQKSILPFMLSDGTGCKSITQDVSAQNFVVNNLTGKTWLIVNVSYSAGHITGLAGMTVGYQLQVSPGPATATFTDVPVGSGQFKFVEALVAAGITAGCGGGNFCPNNPITRGQMAVFLASALGLQFQ